MTARAACLDRLAGGRAAARLPWREPLRAGLLGVVFALAALAQGGPPLPSAELGEIRCSATAAAPLIRIEGTRELVGDIEITCENSGQSEGFEPSGLLEVDVEVSLSAGIANASGFGLGAAVTDAVLVINEKTCVADTAERRFSDCGPGGSTVQDPMLGRRSDSSPGTLRWSDVALPIPGAAIGGVNQRAAPVADCRGRFGALGGCHPIATTLRLTNIRVDAAAAGGSSAAGAVAIPIEASVTLTARGGSAIVLGGSFPVAHAAPGITASTVAQPAGPLCSDGEAFAEVRVAEGFAAAFKTAGLRSLRPGGLSRGDDFYPTGAGLAAVRPPTRIRIGLASVPAGVSVAAPYSAVCGAGRDTSGSRLALVQGASAGGGGGRASSVGPGSHSRLTLTDAGEAVAVYEVISADPALLEECAIRFRLTLSDPDGPGIGGGRIGVSASLAPREGAEPDAVGAVFVDLERAPRPTLQVSECGTTLLFPFVTNQGTFDTAVVLSNTSADPLGTGLERGTCALTFQGAGVGGEPLPAFQGTVAVEPGEQVAFRVSSGNPERGVDPLPDFQGYLVARCGFRHAQGFAFVTEEVGGASVLAQGYLAEVLSQSE